MTLQEAHKYFENLKSKATNKSELKMITKFLYIANELQNRNLSDDEISAIELELDSFDFRSNTVVKRKHYKKALNQFEKYLRDNFSLITKGYYANLGLALGSSFGILFGTAVLSSFERSLGLSLGLIFGMAIGLSIGKSLDTKAKSQGKVL